MRQGVYTALITPFDSDNRIEETVFRNLVEWQITEGVDGLVPVGTTGESPTLSHDEHKEIIEICVDQTKKRVPVIAGAGSNSTSEAIELAQHAERAGADGVLVVTPYYNKPNQRGLYAHYSAVARAVSIPLIIYNIPGRCVIDILPQTIADLARDHKNIVGVKDATGKVERVSEQREKCPQGFVQLSGDDSTALGFNAQGGSGCISVTANVAPRLCAALQQACRNGDYQAALSIHDQLAPLNHALFIEPNPAGIKYALSKLGLASATVRLPLVTVEETTKRQIDLALRHAGLIPN